MRLAYKSGDNIPPNRYLATIRDIQLYDTKFGRRLKITFELMDNRGNKFEKDEWFPDIITPTNRTGNLVRAIGFNIEDERGHDTDMWLNKKVILNYVIKVGRDGMERVQMVSAERYVPRDQQGTSQPKQNNAQQPTADEIIEAMDSQDNGFVPPF